MISVTTNAPPGSLTTSLPFSFTHLTKSELIAFRTSSSLALVSFLLVLPLRRRESVLQMVLMRDGVKCRWLRVIMGYTSERRPCGVVYRFFEGTAALFIMLAFG